MKKSDIQMVFVAFFVLFCHFFQRKAILKKVLDEIFLEFLFLLSWKHKKTP